MSDSKRDPIVQVLACIVLILAVVGVSGYLILYQPWRDLTPWNRLNSADLVKLTYGMSQSDVESVLGGPPGDYGNPELKGFPGVSTMEGYQRPKGSTLQEWFDDRNRFELYFEAGGELVYWHKRARFYRDYLPPAWRKKIPAIVVSAVSSAFGAWTIWLLVRRVNRRDDPRFNTPAPPPDFSS